MKRISKIYSRSDERVEGCVNHSERIHGTELFIRMRNRRGLTLPEAMVSMSIFSMFMTVCCGSMVQYQTTFGRIETSMTYTQQLQAGMDMMAREISQSNLSTFKNINDADIIFPIDISKSPIYFKLATGTNAHGDNIYATNKISLSVNSSDRLVQEEILPNGSVVDSKTLAVNVDKVLLSRLPEGSDLIPNALSIEMTSTTTLSTKEQAMQQASQPSTGDCAEGQVPVVRIVNGQKIILCLQSAIINGEIGDDSEGGGKSFKGKLLMPKPKPIEPPPTSNERNYVFVERVVRLNN